MKRSYEFTSESVSEGHPDKVCDRISDMVVDTYLAKKDDYKQWAKGLKKAGYATDPKYPQKLIDLIQRYQLYKYDNIVLKKKNKPYKVKKGDTLFSISKKFNMPVDAIIELNDLKGNNLSIGQVIMIKK